MAHRSKISGELYQTRFYKAWHNMKSRCYNPNIRSYKDYGGRGIRVCDEWLTFEGFYNDMFTSYRDNLTLDRVNVNSNYGPSNCRWIRLEEQNLNKRNTRLVVYKGETKSLTTWIRELGLKSSTVRTRFYVYDWPIEKCLEYK